MPAGGAAAPTLEHVAVYHRGVDDLARQVAGPLREALARDEVVLLSVDAETWAAVGSAVGPDADGLRWMRADDRYASPARAMTTLRGFVADAVDAGAPAVWSVGALRFDGGPADAAWRRYEHAVNEVLAPYPLRAVCAYDLDRTPADVLAASHASHAGPDGAPPAPLAVGPAPVPTPPSPPVVDLVLEHPSAARRAVVDAFGPGLDGELREDLRLVSSELATNALRHGRRPVRLRAWQLAEAIVLQVLDGGPGIADTYADLRPPHASGDGGRGLNMVAQLASLGWGHDGTCAVVTASIPRR